MKKAMLVFLLFVLPLSACSRSAEGQRDKYYESGLKYLEENRYEEASIQFRNALRDDNDHIPSYLGIAEALRNMGDHRNAIASYQQVIRLDGRNIEAKLELGDYLLASGIGNPDFFKQARQMAEDVLAIEPENVEAFILLGNAFAGQDETDPAIEAYQKALSLDPVNLRATMNLAAAMFRKGEVDKAEAMFKQAIEKHPEAIEARLAIAAFFASTKRPQETEKYLKEAFNLNPADARSISSLTSFYMSANRLVEAEAVLSEAIAREPKEAGPRLGLADFYFRQGRTEMGIEQLEEALKINPGNRNALVRLIEIAFRRNELEKADGHINALLAANRNDAQAHYFRGVLLRRNQKPDEALKSFETAIGLNASLMDAYLEKANLLLIRGDLDGSEETLREALKQNNE
ncbi:MAG TPA: tetratricopeptide repeat protein, partial [Acidobacteriota bacterium]|nr:tetratricopeptide repeat protein [Acidobacteriota bacterium]